MFSNPETLDYEVSKLVDTIISRLGSESKLPPLVYQEVGLSAVPSAGGILYGHVEHENGTQLGPLLPQLKAWESLGLSDISRSTVSSRGRFVLRKT